MFKAIYNGYNSIYTYSRGPPCSVGCKWVALPFLRNSAHVDRFGPTAREHSCILDYTYTMRFGKRSSWYVIRIFTYVTHFYCFIYMYTWHGLKPVDLAHESWEGKEFSTQNSFLSTALRPVALSPSLWQRWGRLERAVVGELWSTVFQMFLHMITRENI